MKDEMYKSLASYYDKIYHWKDYEKEARELKEIIKQFKKSTGNELLDVGCGTGNHIGYLLDDFKCSGVDLNKGILNIAKEKFPSVDFIQSDMAKMNLGKKFDVIVCLFSAIGYIINKNKLRKTLVSFSNHLKDGGIVLIEPWLTKEIYRDGSPHMTIYDSEELKIARLNISERDGDISILDMHYLIAEKDKKVQHFIDRHEMIMFPHELLISLMTDAGLKAWKYTEGIFESRGLLIGLKE
ncbi:MAG: class I SAM-dependent methyltransferase [Candidatus Heimdallarchaeota archaeon]|nr:class I SAM-dependent methyltransferase [Candidatus Heimdallarchaeota archaeon]